MNVALPVTTHQRGQQGPTQITKPSTWTWAHPARAVPVPHRLGSRFPSRSTRTAPDTRAPLDKPGGATSSNAPGGGSTLSGSTRKAQDSGGRRGNIEWLPSGSVRVKVYAGVDPVRQREMHIRELVKATRTR
jgi:hypothetical protein